MARLANIAVEHDLTLVHVSSADGFLPQSGKISRYEPIPGAKANLSLGSRLRLLKEGNREMVQLRASADLYGVASDPFPIGALVGYAVNEVILHRRTKAAGARTAELDGTDPMVHAYREPPS